MKSPSRKVTVSLASLALVIAGVVGYYFYKKHQSQKDLLPTFTEIPVGTRAPASAYSAFFGVQIGKSTYNDVKQLLEKQGLTCEDTSARALMENMREKKLQEIEEKKARGEEDAASTGASWLHHKSRLERNPQVRLTCHDTPSSKLGDTERVPAVGRWLFVFDSLEYPLRHVSYRRSHADADAAIVDFTKTLERLSSILGEPISKNGEIPAMPNDGSARKLPLFRPYKRSWGFSDLKVEASLTNFNKRGIDVYEAVEVPWPVRADAPTLPR